MALVEQQPQFGPDEFAFHFETEIGVDADALANFLKRAATAARRAGGEIRVVGLQEGSLNVILKAFKKGAAKEFKDKPIDTTIKSTVFVTAIVTAIVHMMSPQLRHARYVRNEVERFMETYVLFNEVQRRCELRGPHQIFFTLSGLGLKPELGWGEGHPLVFRRDRFSRVLRALQKSQAAHDRAA